MCEQIFWMKMTSCIEIEWIERYVLELYKT